VPTDQIAPPFCAFLYTMVSKEEEDDLAFEKGHQSHQKNQCFPLSPH
jgi:hypothetical protein